MNDKPDTNRPVIARAPSVDPADFDVPEDQREAKYGLPQKVQFCKRCVISNQRPSSAVEFAHTSESCKSVIQLDEEGICDACRAVEVKNTKIAWQERERELGELCDRHRRDDGRYDCIVPGSGGKDSFFAAHQLKMRFGMHPLTVTWAPHIYTDWGWRNFQRWMAAGFDNALTTPNGRVHRLLTRLAVEKIFHPFQPFIIGQKALGPRESVLRDVPLVFYGENEAEYGNPIADNLSAMRDRSFFATDDTEDLHLAGTPVGELMDSYGLEKADLAPYMPTRPEDLDRSGTEVHYLGYYLKWHPQSCYYYAVDHGGFEPSPERTPGTYSKYSGIDDKIDDFHFFTTYIKFGIGRASYDAAQEIRSGDIIREEGVALVRRYDGEFTERFAEELFRYLSLPEDEFPDASAWFEQPIMDRDYFFDLCDRFRSPHLWKYENGTWALRHAVWDES